MGIPRHATDSRIFSRSQQLSGHLGRQGRTDDEVVQQDELLEVTAAWMGMVPWDR